LITYSREKDQSVRNSLVLREAFVSSFLTNSQLSKRKKVPRATMEAKVDTGAGRNNV
jgi:hypothetical protein